MDEILNMLREAIAVSQCTEDSAAGRIKTALGIVNGMLLTVQQELEAIDGRGA